MGVGSQHRDHDALWSSASERKIDWNQNKKAEKGITIKVGSEPNTQEKEITTEQEAQDELCGIDFEPLF